jgi:hypothetical protein
VVRGLEYRRRFDIWPKLKKKIRSLVPVVPILWPSEKFRSKAENHKLPIDENCIFAILPKSFLGPPELKISPNDPILF